MTILSSKKSLKQLKSIFKATGISVLKLTGKDIRIAHKHNLTDAMQRARIKNAKWYDAVEKLINEETFTKEITEKNLCGTDVLEDHNVDPSAALWRQNIFPADYGYQDDMNMFIALHIEKKEVSIKAIVMTNEFMAENHVRTVGKVAVKSLEVQFVCGKKATTETKGNGIGTLLVAYSLAWNGSRKSGGTTRYTNIWAEMTRDGKRKYASLKLFKSFGMKRKGKTPYIAGDMKAAMDNILKYDYKYDNEIQFNHLCPFEGRNQCS
jgi:hypothetical protein